MILDVMNMVNVKMVLVYVLLDGMVSIVRWKGVRMDVLGMDSVVLIQMVLGSVDVMKIGMVKIVVFFWNKVVMMVVIMIKVSEINLSSDLASS